MFIYLRYCQEFYQPDFNRRGDCKFAPDRMKNGIENISGIFCARCMVYHCIEDSEDNSINHPCSCRNDENNCKKRWISLALLSIFCVPCLWCYPPLKACHWISMKCGICGAKHKPQIWQPIKIDNNNLYNHEKISSANINFPTQPLPNLYQHRNFHHETLNTFAKLPAFPQQTITIQPIRNKFIWICLITK